MDRRVLALIACVWIALPSRAARADAPVATEDEQVAAALFERGLKLYDGGEWGAARTLFVQVVERTPNGTHAARARELIVRCEVEMGLRAAPPSTPDPPPSAAAPAPDAVSSATPIAPYDEAPPRSAPITFDVVDENDPETLRKRDVRVARTSLVLSSGAYGFVATILVIGAAGADAPATVGLLGGAVGAFTGYMVVRDRDVRSGDVGAWISGLTWGSVAGLALAGVLDDPLACDHDPFLCTNGGEDVRARHYHLSSLVGGVAGVGVGALVSAIYHPSTGDVALVNSMTLYGVGAGLLLSLAIPPAQDRGTTLDALLGGGVGLIGGLVLAPYVETSRSRMLLVDLGAIAGAFTGYFLLGAAVGNDDTTDDDEQLRSVLALGGMTVGALATFYFTRHRDRPRAAGKPPAAPPPAALITRDGDGTWSFGGLAPASIVAPSGHAAPGLSIVSGRF